MGNKPTKPNVNPNNNTYTWKIPSLEKHDIDLLCNGYIRSNTLYLDIPTDIIGLCIQFFNDNYEMDRIFNAKNGESFKSSIFSINQCKFYQDICPNGDKLKDIGKFEWFLNIVSLPPKIREFHIYYRVSLLEMNTYFSEEVVFSRKEWGYKWFIYDFLNKMRDSKTITFILEIKGVNIIYEIETKYKSSSSSNTNNNKSDKPKQERIDNHAIMVKSNLDLPFGNYKWNINNSDIKFVKNGKIWTSISTKIFIIQSFKWMLKLYKRSDNTYDVGMFLVCLSPNIQRLCIFYTLTLEELYFEEHRLREFQHHKLSHLCSKFNKNKDVWNLDAITFKLKIVILDVYDKMGNRLTMNDISLISNPSLLIPPSRKYQYTWRVSDPSTLQNMKIAQNNKEFNSSCFAAVSSCKWFISFYPNLKRNDNDLISYAAIMLNLISLSPDVVCIAVIFELNIPEMDQKTSHHYQFRRDDRWGVQPMEFDILHLDHITFQVTMYIIDVYDKDGKAITASIKQIDYQKQKQKQKQIDYDDLDHKSDDEKDIDLNVDNNNIINKSDQIQLCESIQLSSDTFIWNVTDSSTISRMKNAQKGIEFMGPIFSMYKLKWYLEFHPIAHKSDDIEFMRLYVALVSLPPKIASVSFKFTLIFEETNTEYSHFVQFYEKHVSIGWPQKVAPKRDKLNDIAKFTFIVTINLMDIYDKNGNDITNQYNNNYNIDLNDNDNDDDIDLKEQLSLPSPVSPLSSRSHSVTMSPSTSKQLEFESEQYIWKITDKSTVKKIRKAKHLDFINSPIFELHGFRFMMQICPNGSNIKDRGKFAWYLCLTSLSPSISRIWIFYTIKLIETNTLENYRMKFESDSSGFGWDKELLSFNKIRKLKLLRFTFKLNIGIIDVFDFNGNIITNNYRSLIISRHRENEFKIYDYALPRVSFIKQPKIISSFIWNINNKNLIKKIKKSQNGQHFDSKIFNDNNNYFKFNLEFYPNGTNIKTKSESILKLHLISLPLQLTGISIYFELIIKKPETIWTSFTHFRNNHLSKGWSKNRVKIKDIQKNKKFNFNVNISLCDIYDNNNNIITDKYWNKQLYHD